ncbi:solute carrier organic anion transporter family member 2A1-like isoform X2 [Ptychodera flava]|uniref:solute carrier organic anion transporter family member 2A1-like isoform X2 n=1 Tax=Ptychodera flava TaxID=63121 RepID=UPI003969D3B2
MEGDKSQEAKGDDSKNAFLMDEHGNKGKKSASDGQANLADSDDYTCGIGSWRPRWLQAFANVKVAFVVIMLTTVITTLNFASFSTAVVSWERQFALSSTVLGACFTFLDLSSLIALPLMTYFGGQATSHRPRWIGFGILLSIFGLLIIGFTQFISDPYEYGEMPGGSFNSSSGLCVPGQTGDSIAVSNQSLVTFCEDSALSGNSLTVLLCLFLGLLLMGVGITPLFTLGVSYIDDNVQRKKAPLYFGILYSMYGLGPLIGYPMAAYYTNKYVDYYRVDESTVEIDKTDPRWVGAWWIGFFVNATLLLFAAIPLFLLPKKLRKPKEDVEEAEKIEDDIKEVTMSEKIKAIGFIIPSTIGIFTGGVLLRRFKPTLKKIARNITIVHLLCLLMIIPLMFIGCENYKFAGINYSYPSSSNGSIHDTSNGMDAKCNTECMCPPNSPFNPVCGSDGVTYSSACHAGCAARQQTSDPTAMTLSGCSCVENLKGNDEERVVAIMMYSTEGTTINQDGAQMDDELTIKFEHSTTDKVVAYNDTKAELYKTPMRNSTVIQLSTEKPSDVFSPHGGVAYNPSDDGGTARPGICGEQCTKQLIAFTVLLFCMSFIKSLPQTASLEILLRSVKPTEKPFALGIRAMFSQLFAWLPTSIYIGAIFDSACQYWGRNPCGDRGTCWVYDVDAYRLRYYAVIMFLKLLTVIFCFLTWFTLRGKAPTDREENGYKAVATSPDGNSSKPAKM